MTNQQQNEWSWDLPKFFKDQAALYNGTEIVHITEHFYRDGQHYYAVRPDTYTNRIHFFTVPQSKLS